MNGTEKQIREVLHNLNWLLEPHESFVELISVEGEKAVIRCVGACVGCETDCIGTTFRADAAYRIDQAVKGGPGRRMVS